jgi:hypothetical protein
MRIIKLFLFWIELRRKNKQLLKRLETADTTPYPPPTREELLAFIEKAEARGVKFNKLMPDNAYVSIN